MINDKAINYRNKHIDDTDTRHAIEFIELNLDIVLEKSKKTQYTELRYRLIVDEILRLYPMASTQAIERCLLKHRVLSNRHVYFFYFVCVNISMTYILFNIIHNWFVAEIIICAFSFPIALLIFMIMYTFRITFPSR